MSENSNPFEGRNVQDVLRVRLADDRIVEGSYLTQGGMHFVHVRDGSPNGRVEGPIYDPLAVRLIRSREDVLDERFDRSRGTPVPGILRRDRDGYEARLERLARAAASAPDFRRRREVDYQFNDVADEISLAQGKRKWLLAVAQWSRFSNAEPTKMDLSSGDMTQAQKLAKPRPQDFDPNEHKRRARVPLPEYIAIDPLSPHNMIKALNRAGFNARVSVVGEFTFDMAELLVDFPGGKKFGRYMVTGQRGADGAMNWRTVWEGNLTRTDLTRRARAERSGDFLRFKTIVSKGLLALQVEPATEPAEPEPMMIP